MANYIQYLDILRDPTEGLIKDRFVWGMLKLSDSTDLSDHEKKEFHDLVILLGLKLVISWTHWNNYKNIEQNLIAKLGSEKDIKDSNEDKIFQYSQELFFEFDEFFVQVKSCLDYLVKIPRCFLGANKWNARTFDEEKVIKALGSLPKEARCNQVAKSLQKHIEESKNNWIKIAVDVRNDLNHHFFQGDKLGAFLLSKNLKDVNGAVSLTMFDEKKTIIEVMEIIWRNLLKFVDNFCGSFAFIRLQEGLGIVHQHIPSHPTQSPWMVVPEEQVEPLITVLSRFNANNKN